MLTQKTPVTVEKVAFLSHAGNQAETCLCLGSVIAGRSRGALCTEVPEELWESIAWESVSTLFQLSSSPTWFQRSCSAYCESHTSAQSSEP